jgi:Ohr subfamily peroxiredoxin
MAFNLIRPLSSFRAMQSFGGSMRTYTALYTAHCTATGGRDGRAKCDDNPAHLDVKLVRPKGLGGSGGDGTNPEELFAAGYSGCFLGAMGLAAKNLKKTLPQSTTVSAAVTIGKHDNGNLGLKVELTAKLPGATQADADAIVQAAHQVCPYSRKCNFEENK